MGRLQDFPIVEPQGLYSTIGIAENYNILSSIVELGGASMISQHVRELAPVEAGGV